MAVGGAVVAPAAEGVHQGFGDIFQHGETAGHIPVQGSVAHSQFALVAGSQYQPAELVGYGHKEVAADAGLDIFLGDIGGGAGEMVGEQLVKGEVRRLDGDAPHRDAEVIGQLRGVGDAAFG